MQVRAAWMALMFLSVVLGGCLGPAPQTDDVPFRSIIRGGTSGIEEPLEVVVSTSAQWEDIWARHMEDYPNASAPTIDFTRERVVGVFLGAKPTSAWGVTIESVERSSEGITVGYGVNVPDDAEAQPQALSQPFHLVAIPAGDEEVAFVGHAE